MNETTFVRQESDGYLCYCQICNDAYLLKTPMAMDEFSRKLKQFAKKHKNCSKETPNGTPKTESANHAL